MLDIWAFAAYIIAAGNLLPEVWVAHAIGSIRCIIRLESVSTQGVKAISLREGDVVQDATALPSVEDIEQDSAEAKETFDKVEGVEVDDDSVEKIEDKPEQQIGVPGGDEE